MGEPQGSPLGEHSRGHLPGTLHKTRPRETTSSPLQGTLEYPHGIITTTTPLIPPHNYHDHQHPATTTSTPQPPPPKPQPHHSHHEDYTTTITPSPPHHLTSLPVPKPTYHYHTTPPILLPEHHHQRNHTIATAITTALPAPPP
jgi:hypothetical protein